MSKKLSQETRFGVLLGKRIRGLRRARKLTQEQFAAKVGLSRGFLSEVETGHKRMSLHTFARFCRRLRATGLTSIPHYLIEGLG